jgi:hypothetical protein
LAIFLQLDFGLHPWPIWNGVLEYKCVARLLQL